MDFEPFLETLQLERGCTEQTIRAYRSDLSMFAAFMRECGLSRTKQVTHDVIRNYIKHMQEKDNPRFSRTGLSPSSVARRLAAVSSYVEYLRATGNANIRNPIREVKRRWK